MTPAEIARGLSEPMRDAMLFGLNGYFDPNTIRGLRRRNLVIGIELTPLGQQVAAVLRDSST